MSRINDIPEHTDWADMEDSPLPQPCVKPQPAPVTVFKEQCKDCKGTGLWGYNPPRRDCYKCGGKGYHEYKTSATHRAAERVKTQARKDTKRQEQYELFTSSNATEWAWVVESANKGNNFAQSLKASVDKYGSLLPGQIAAVQRILAAREVGKAEAAARQAGAKEVNVEPMVRAFSALLAAGLKTPKLRFNGLKFSPARLHPGVYYVTSTSRMDGEGKGAYLGKIDTVTRFATAQFVRSRDCTPEDEANVVRVCADPLGSARAYGRFSGNCCVCGRKLTDPVSVANGIGPICETNAGWGA